MVISCQKLFDIHLPSIVLKTRRMFFVSRYDCADNRFCEFYISMYNMWRLAKLAVYLLFVTHSARSPAVNKVDQNWIWFPPRSTDLHEISYPNWYTECHIVLQWPRATGPVYQLRIWWHSERIAAAFVHSRWTTDVWVTAGEWAEKG